MTGAFFVPRLLPVVTAQKIAKASLGDDRPVGLQVVGQVGVENLRVGRCQLRADHALFADVEPIEQGEAQVSPHLGAPGAVHLVAALDASECLLEGAFHGMGLHGQRSDDPFRVGTVASDPSLFLLKQSEGNGVRVVSGEELLLLTVETSQPEPLVIEFALVLLGCEADQVDDADSDGFDLLRADADAAPVLLDARFHLLHGQVGQGAPVRVMCPPSQAEEVGVLDPRFRPAPAEAQTSLAVAAREDALQVVRALDRLLVPLAVIEHRLHVVEQRLVDKRFVPTRVLDAVVADHADVVRVAQHVVDLAAHECLRCVALVALAGEPSFLEGFGHLAEGPFARSEVLEGPPDVGGTLWVDRDGADLATLDRLDRVEVADGRPIWGAAQLRLLLHALPGFRGEVRAVELGDRGHDPVEQLAARAVIDVLRGGDDLGAGGADVHDDADVVFAGPGEAVDLVNDDVVDVACEAQPLQHRLELRPGSGPGGFASVEVLVDHGRSDLLSLPSARLALGGDREALVGEVRVGLLARGDP